MREAIVAVSGLASIAATIYAALVLLARRGADKEIDRKIAANRYRYKRGMKKPDYEKIHDVGKRRWAEVGAAQARVSERERKVSPIGERSAQYGWCRPCRKTDHAHCAEDGCNCEQCSTKRKRA